MQDKQYAGFWIRVGALLIDSIIILIVTGLPLTFIYGKQYWFSEQYLLGFWDILISYILPFIATIWFWLRFLATPGKMAVNLEVVDAQTGNPMTLSQAIIRYFAYIPATLLFGIGIIWVAFDPKKQGWHDKIAGTVVIKHGNKPVEFS